MKKVIILGAAGRDFHNFNVYFRDNKEYKVIAFTAAQIPFISDRVYPSTLAGRFYPNGIPIYDEDRLEELIDDYDIDEVVFAYSDVSYKHLMHLASKVVRRSSFKLLGAKDTQLIANKPVIAVTATRTGSGKSTISRMIANIAKEYADIGIIRHPMPYLTFEPIQIFKSIEDLDKYPLTLEEEEEYINHLRDGNIVYAGVDYSSILKEAERHDLILWDGGNNDLPFIKPDLHITIIDPLRADDAVNYYPSEVNLMNADMVIISKADLANEEQINVSKDIVKQLNDNAKIFALGSYNRIDKPELIKGKRVLIIDDAPSITHGEVKDNIAIKLARSLDAEIIDPRPYTKGSIRSLYEKYDIRDILPTAGYNDKQLKDLEDTIDGIDAQAVILATPADLTRRIRINKPIARIESELKGYDYNSFTDYLKEWIKNRLR